jgi:hypothetical protein
MPRKSNSKARVIQDDSDEDMAENKEEQTPFRKTIPSYAMTETPASPLVDSRKVASHTPMDTASSFATPAPRSIQTPASRIGTGFANTPASRIGLASSNRTPATGSTWKSGPPSTAASSRSFKQKNAERYAWLEFPKDAQKRLLMFALIGLRFAR